MKEERKNEVDLLLRRLARRDEAIVPDADHLDADELSAYAENALPAAARARYTAHLAECSRCRELVVQLSSSVGVVVATEAEKVAGPVGWRKFLASLFTPLVLRYAVPALGLIIVAAIGFVVLRREQPAADIAQANRTSEPAAPLPSPGSPTFSYGPSAATPSPSASIDRQAKRQADTPAPPPNEPPAVSVDAEVAQDRAAQPKPEQQPAVANEAAPAAKPTPSPTPQATADAAVSKKEVRELPAAAAPASEKDSRAEEREDKDNFATARKSKVQTGSASRAQGIANGQLDGVSANTRNVAGRHFQKKGGVWIDTAYDSSKDAVTLTRGSEQYRALVADEPQIKTIADELGGEIIVVWKGHTYRIR